MKDEVKCMDCINFDLKDGFYSSNLRKCAIDGLKHWKGDDAECCMNFGFREEERHAG